MEVAEQRFDARLTTIAQKPDLLEKGQQEFNQKTEQFSNQVIELEKKENRLAKALKLLEDDFKHMKEETKDEQRVVGNADNTLRKNN